MGSGGVAIAALPTVICLKVPFSDGLGEGYVIYQDCWQTKAGVLVFSLEQSSIEGFFEDSTVYEYTPDFEFDKKKAYYNARRNFSEPGNSVWG